MVNIFMFIFLCLFFGLFPHSFIQGKGRKVCRYGYEYPDYEQWCMEVWNGSFAMFYASSVVGFVFSSICHLSFSFPRLPQG